MGRYKQENKYHIAIRRIERMEEYFDLAVAALNEGDDTDTKSNVRSKLSKKLRTLSAYMDSGLWQHDYELDEAGLLPHSLKRGVLSQDGLYDLLDEFTWK